MTIETTHDMTNPRPTADSGRSLVKKLIASIEENFRLPAIQANYVIQIHPWLLERVVVRVSSMPDTTGDLRMVIQRQTRSRSAFAPRVNYTEWETVPENTMENVYWAEPVVRDAVESRPEDDLRSYLSAWMVRSDMTHLIR